MMVVLKHEAAAGIPWKRLGLVALLQLWIPACAPASSLNDPTAGWLEASSPKALEVERAAYRHSVRFETDRDDISLEERDRLIAFLQGARPGGRDSLRIEGHADERAGEAYNLDLAARRIDAVSSFLRAQGVRDIELAMSSFGERAPAVERSDPAAWAANRRVDIVLERYLVTPPACPDWSRESGVDYANLPHSNFGCATQTNLGLMIAEPRDLVTGRRLGPADGVHQAEGIVRYRDGKLKELEEERVQ